MNRYFSIILFAIAVLMTSCDPDYAVEDYFDLEELPGYVAFDADGNNATLDAFDVTEDDGSLEIEVENPTGSISAITVNYTLGGTALYGTDYTIEGATAAGGSITIQPSAGAVNETSRASMMLTILADSTVDGDKQITITLADASNSEGNVAVGRGGKDFLKAATVNIADVD